MLDTIKLCVPIEQCAINSPKVFKPSLNAFIRKNIKYICNPSKNSSLQGEYQPKLTLIKDFDNNTNLFIEFSAPKIVFGNNFDELETTDFEKVLYKLHDKLKSLDIEIPLEVLRNAKVSAIHYSKNIELKNAQCVNLIEVISKLDISKRLDVTKTDYKNGGQLVRFHTNSYELAFYDKISDLQQSIISEKRAFEKNNIIQQNLLQQLCNREVLRIEVRLNKPKKIKFVAEKCNIDIDELSFKNLFNSDISKKILNYYWDEFIEKSIYFVCQSSTSTNIIISKAILAGYGKQKALKLAGILAQIKESGCRQTKELIKEISFARYVKDIELLELDDNYILKKFREVRKQIQKMKPLRIANRE